MIGVGGTVVDASAQLAPVYWGILTVLAISAIGILALSPLPRRLRFWIAALRYRRFGGPGQPAWTHRLHVRA